MLTTWLLAAGREVQKPTAAPRVLDALEPKRSMFTAVQQYLSSLLRGQGTRLKFLYRHLGLSSWDALCASENADHKKFLRLFRTGVLVASAGINRRLILPLQQDPWRLLRAGDLRESETRRRSIAEEFMTELPCCKKPGFARRLRSRIQAPEELLTPKMILAYQLFARKTRLGIACIEWRHAWNRQHSSESTSCQSLASSFTTREATYLQAARQQAARLRCAADEAATNAAVDDEQLPAAAPAVLPDAPGPPPVRQQDGGRPRYQARGSGMFDNARCGLRVTRRIRDEVDD